MPLERILINRAPVLTLWASIVAERLGFDRDEALSLGKTVAGLTAQSKGRKLGIFAPSPGAVKRSRRQQEAKEFSVEICGRAVPAINSPAGIRALAKGKPVEPVTVERYLEGKFGDALGPARSAMTGLAKAFKPEQLAVDAFRLYEVFRPKIPLQHRLDIYRVRLPLAKGSPSPPNPRSKTGGR